MSFHQQKCSVLSAMRKHQTAKASYQLHRHALTNVNKVKYPGITSMTSDNTCSSHINDTADKTKRTLGNLNDVIVRTSDNRLLYGRPANNQFLPVSSVNPVLLLESGELPDTPMAVWFDARGSLYVITVNDSVTSRRLVPLQQEILNVVYPDMQCPYLEMTTGIEQKLFHMDKRETIDVTCKLIYRNRKTNIPRIELLFNEHYHVRVNTTTRYDYYGDNVMESLMMTFTQDWVMNKKTNYRQLERESFRIIPFQLLPTISHPFCKPVSLVSHILVGCPTGRNIRLKRPKQKYTKECKHFSEYTIKGIYRQDYWDAEKVLSDITVPYDFGNLGCPISLRNTDVFIPDIWLYDFEMEVKPVEANLILWEEHSRKDYEYNNTMYEVLCWRKAQTWKSMLQQFAAGTYLGYVWGPENYESCFDRADGLSNKEELSRPYEIINRTGGVGITIPIKYYAVFVFNVKVLDPDYSFCPLTTQFAVVVSNQEHARFLVALTMLGITIILISFCIGTYIYFMNCVYLRTE
ncbi:Cation channel sperm-associated protein subunit epsilon [Lamellibrachia satsuma]|nr:Cation channel sperm-associated protein subunit epsilon [Lamellibrachia satsuma]